MAVPTRLGALLQTKSVLSLRRTKSLGAQVKFALRPCPEQRRTRLWVTLPIPVPACLPTPL